MFFNKNNKKFSKYVLTYNKLYGIIHAYLKIDS